MSNSCLSEDSIEESIEEYDERRGSIDSQSMDNDTTHSKAPVISKWFTPNSKVRVSWNAFIFMAIWYNSLVTPIRLFIIPLDRTPQGIIDADIVFDFIFVIDTCLSFFIPFSDENTGKIITDLKAIRNRYTGSVNFFINVIACVPILKTPISLFLDNKSQQILVTNFNILRMVRVLHFPSQFQELKRYRSRNGPVNESVFRMWIILFFAFLLMCILGCVYFGWSTASVENMCPLPEDFESQILSIDMWVADDSVITDVMNPFICNKENIAPRCNECPQLLFLTRSVYFLMQTLFTIGYGDSVVPSKSMVEMAMACVFMIFGVFGYGLIIANMTSVLSNVDVVSMRFRHDMDNISRWLTLRAVPDKLKDRIRMFFTYLNKNQNGMLDDLIFADLPPKLSQDLANHYLPFLKKVPFFDQNLRSKQFLHKIASVLKRRIYPPGSYILYQFEKQRELIIIKTGRAEICTKDDINILGYLGPGEFMGDYQLLFGTVNQVGLRSQDFTEVLVLTFDDLEKVMDCPYQNHFQFRSLGGNFRGSKDEGALKTITHAISAMEKISAEAENISRDRNSFRNSIETSKVIVKGFRIYPNSKLNVGWDIFALIGTMYYTVSCPIYLAAFYREGEFKSTSHYVSIIAYVIDACFIIDIFLRMKVYAYVSFESGKNEVIDNRRMMTKCYFTSHKFKLDLVASLPFDVLALYVNQHPGLRLPKIIRALQISELISALQKHLEDSCNIILNETHVSCLLMFLYSVMIIVWISSGWYAIRPNESAYDAVYWALTTLTTVGYGDLTPINLPQTIFALFVGAAGATFSAAIIANVTSFFHDVELSEENVDHKLNCVKHFIERYSTSLEHTKKIQEYFDFIERDQDGLNEEVLLSRAIPDHIRSNILTHITKSMVMNCNFFVNCESGFIRKIMLSIEQRFFGTGFMIMNSSTPSDGMFFVKKGIIELLKKKSDGTLNVSRKVEADQSFAEDCLLQHWEKNPFLARAAADSELWFLSRSKFNRIIEDFPRSYSVLRDMAGQKEMHPKNRRASIHDLQKIAVKSQNNKIFIHPDNIFIQCWFGVVLMVILYSIVVLPFRIAFMENQDHSIVWLSLDYLGDLLFIVDLILRGYFLAYYENNHLVTSGKKIWSRYINSKNMKWHVLSIIPCEIMTLFFPTLCPFWKLQLWSIFRLNKVLRTVEISYIFNKVESNLAKAGIKVPKNPLRVGKLLTVTLLSAHWVACIFFIIANINHHSNSFNNRNNWASTEDLLVPNPECPGKVTEMNMMVKQYVASLYFSIATLTTVGYGDITASENSAPEIIFATVILVIGTAIYTLVIALLEDIVSQLDVTSSLYKMKMNNIEMYMQIQGLPDNIKNKTTAYYEYLWRKQLGIKGNRLLKYMPRSLRCELMQDMLSNLIQKTFFVKSCSADFVATIVESLTLELYLPDDIIFNEGERCEFLYFIHAGEVGLFTTKNVKFQTVSKCLLCEGNFFSFEPHICNGKAIDSCEIFQLSMNDFLTNLHENQLTKRFVEYVAENENQLRHSKASIEKMIQNLKSSKMAKMMVVEVDTTIPRGVISPDSKFRRTWDLLALTASIIFAITIPQQISFSAQGVQLSDFILDFVLDTFFIVDLYARMNHFAVIADGALISNPKEFRKIYMKRELIGDFISIIPVSTVGWIAGANGRSYGLMRLFQITRLRRFEKYLNCCIETLYEVFHIVISTAVLRILQMFLLVVILCHWLGCVFHFIGDSTVDKENWLDADEMQGNSTSMRYLRSFYWALYTVTTVGYGSVPVISNAERIFAMFVMCVGAILCDAGITAVLTSIISRKDHQAGTNNRRIQCSKKFMISNFIGKDLQNCILDFYNYIDTEIKNIDEAAILCDLSHAIKMDILQNFCFATLRKCYAFQDFSNGALISLLKLMSPYIAIPGETICEVGKICEYIFVLQRGRMVWTDYTGSKVYVPVGAVIGHMATNAIQEIEGLPSKCIIVEILSSTGLKGKHNPYVEISYGSMTIRSSIRQGKGWSDIMKLKVTTEVNYLKIKVKGWHKNAKHNTLGEAKINFTHDSADIKEALLTDIHGKKVGSLKIKITHMDLGAYDSLNTLEMTSTAVGYSHLYRLEVTEIENLRLYLARAKLPNIIDRMPITCQEEHQHKDDKMGEWRRPSRPSMQMYALSTSCEIKQNNEIINQNSRKGRSLQQMWNQIDRRRRSPSIAPESHNDEMIIEAKQKKMPSNVNGKVIRTMTLSEEAQELEKLTPSEDDIEQMRDLKAIYDGNGALQEKRGVFDHNNIDWDNLVKFSDPSKMVNANTTDRENFFVEWASEVEPS